MMMTNEIIRLMHYLLGGFIAFILYYYVFVLSWSEIPTNPNQSPLFEENNDN
jgi:hypothetical protein